MPSAPSFQDLLDARLRVYGEMAPSALQRYPLLDQWVGCETWVKHENHNPTTAFKVRGGLNLVSRLSAEERARGVVSASTGNHGQSIAYASRAHGVPCTIVVSSSARARWPIRRSGDDSCRAMVSFTE